MTTIFVLIMCVFSGFVGYEYGLEKCEQNRQIENINQRIDMLEKDETPRN